MRRRIRFPSLGTWRSRRALVLVSLFLVAGFFLYYYLDRYVRLVPGTAQITTSRLEELVRRSPGDAHLRLQLAGAYAGQRSYDDAVKQYQAALKLEEENPAAYLGLGNTYYLQGKHPQAQESYQKVIAFYQDKPYRRTLRPLNAMYYNLADIYDKEGKLEQAVASLEEALAIDRVDADALHRLGALKLRLGGTEEAVKACEEAVRYVPDFAEAYETLAAAYESLGQSDLQHYAQGMMSYGRRRYGDAVRLLEGAAQRLPNHLPAQLGLALAYEKAGQRDKALAGFKAALELDKENLLARFGVQRLEQRP